MGKALPAAGDALQRVASPLSNTLTTKGQQFYNQGVLPILQAGRKTGKTELGEQMLESGIRGNPEAIAEKMIVQKDAIGKQMGSALEALQEAGSKGDAMVAFQPYLAKVGELQRKGLLSSNQAQSLAEHMLEPHLEYIARNGRSVPTDLLHEWRQSVDANLISQAAWGPQSAATPASKKVSQVLAKSLRDGLNAEVDRSSAGALGKEFSDNFRELNRKWGDIGNPKVQNAAQAMANTSEKRSSLTPGDIAATGLGLLGGPMVHRSAPEAAAAAFLAKKGYDAATSTAGRTYIGTGMKRFGDSPAGALLDAYARRKLINSQKEKENGEK